MTLSEEQQMLQQLAERLFSDKAHVSTLRELRDNPDSGDYDTALWQSMVESGLTGILVPEAHGGMAFGLVGAGLVAAEIGRTLAATPYLSTAVLGALCLSHGGTEAQQSQWLPAIADGSAIVALAIDEDSKHQPDRVHAKAKQGPDGWIVSGDKTLVLDAPLADLLIVLAHDGDRNTLFAVDPNADGVAIEATRMVDGRSTGRVSLDQALAQPFADGEGALETALRAGRALLAVEMAALSQEVFRRTLDYLHDRKQFGRAIGSFQALQHRAADLSVEIAIAEAMAWQALAACDRNDPDADAQVFAAKAKAAQVARLATAEGVQMHGGMGMTDEFDIGFFMKRARAAGETLGDANYCTDLFAVRQNY